MSDHEVRPEALVESTEIVSDSSPRPERLQRMLSTSLPYFSPAQTQEAPLIMIEAVMLNTTISPTETYTRPIYASPTAIAAGLLPGDNSDFGDILHTFKDALCTLQVVLRVMGRGTTESLSFRESSLIGNSLHEYLIWESGCLEAHEAVLETAYVVELPPMTSPEDRSELTRRLQVLDQQQRLLFAKDWHENVGILNEDAIDWLRTCHHPFVTRPTASPNQSASTSRTASPAASNGPRDHYYSQRVEGDNFRSRSPSVSGSFINLDPQSQSLSRSDSATTIRSPILELGGQARAVDLLQQVGFWIYGTAVGQIMTNAPDPRENYKKLYSPSPIWLMGNQFRSEFWDFSVGWRRVVSLSPIQKLLYRAPPPGITTSRSPGKSYSVREWLRAESCEIDHLVPLLASLLDSSPLGPAKVRYKIEQDGQIVLEATKDCLGFSLRSRGALIDCEMVAPKGHALEARTLFSDILSSILSLATQCATKSHHVPRIERLLLHVYGSQITEGPYPQIPNSQATLPTSYNLDEAPKEMNVLLWSAYINDWISRLITINPSQSKLRIHTLDPSGQHTELNLKESVIFAFDDDSRRFALTHKTFGCICFRATSPDDFGTIVKLAAHQVVDGADFKAPELLVATVAPQLPPTIGDKVEMDSDSGEMGGLDEFLTAFESCFWFTYRRDLPRLVPSILSSDAGFGCMLRAGQSMMAEALAVLLLGRHRNLDRILSEPQALEQYKAVISLFLDVEDQAAIFSVVHLIQLGVHMGVPIGQHFNPSVLARALRQQCHRRPDIPCEVFFVKNGEIARALLLDKVRHKAQVVLMTLRLGADCLNPQYTALIKTAISSPYSLGVIGGRAPRAFYIVGFQDDSLLYLDPHLLRGTCLDMTRIVTKREYHTRAVCELSLSHLDPTVLFGFLCQNEADVQGLIGSLLSTPVPMPLFSVVGLRPQRNQNHRKEHAKGILEFDTGGLDGAPRVGGGENKDMF